METNITGKLFEITEDKDGKPFCFTLVTQHEHEVRVTPAFFGDDHFGYKSEDMPLHFSTFEKSMKEIIKHASIGDRLKITFVLRSKKYPSGWATFLNPRIIVNEDVEGLYSRSEIRGVI